MRDNSWILIFNILKKLSCYINNFLGEYQNLGKMIGGDDSSVKQVNAVCHDVCLVLDLEICHGNDVYLFVYPFLFLSPFRVLFHDPLVHVLADVPVAFLYLRSMVGSDADDVFLQPLSV